MLDSQLIFNIMFFPFKDIAFYNLDILENLDIFKKKLHKNIVRKCNVTNIDEINLLLSKYYPDLVYGSIKNNKKKLFDIFLEKINTITNSMISTRDGEIIFKYWKRFSTQGKYIDVYHLDKNDEEIFGGFQENEKAILFNTLNKFIPIDIFIANYYSMNNIGEEIQLTGFYQNINLADSSLNHILMEGISENHIHASAAFNFTSLWEGVMNFNENKNYFNNININAYSNFTSTEEIENYIYVAILIRTILTLYLKKIERNKDLDITSFLYKNIIKTKKNEENQKEFYLEICEYIKDPNKIPSDMAYEKKINGKKTQNKYCLRNFINNLLNINMIDFENENKTDIILTIFKEHSNIKTYGENIFLFKCLKYIKHNQKANNFIVFCDLFFKYIMIKNEFYQLIVEQQRLKGLDFFQSHFKGATAGFNKNNSAKYFPMMLRSLFQNKYLKQVELRFSFPNNIDNLKNAIYNFLYEYKKVLEEDYDIIDGIVKKDFPKIGIIYHLIKTNDKTDKCWYSYKEGALKSENKLRYKILQDNYYKSIEQLIELRNNIPYLADFVVGLDAASLENNTPINILAPIFLDARDSSSDKNLNIDRNGNLVPFKSLMFTIHAGEDFRHIISGLRRIDEVIDYCKFHAGDRIGHAIALGISVDEWIKNNSTVIIPRGEYLDNLLWIWGLYTENISFDSEINIYLENKIQIIAKEIFGYTVGLDKYVLYESYRRRFSKIYINEMLKEDNRKDVNCYKNTPKFLCLMYKGEEKIWDVEKVMHAYHCKCYLDRLETPIFVTINKIEEKIIKDIQEFLINKISTKGIIIEVNPTSNSVIGQINNIYDNQIFKLNKLEKTCYKNIGVCVASDDPIVFNTNLSNEIAYIYYGMLNKGYGKEDTLKWIKSICKSSIDSSFIDSSISCQEYYRKLELVLEELKKY